MQFTISVLTTLALVAGSNAHLKMAQPQQWGYTDSFAASPLSGDDFPCQNFYNLDTQAYSVPQTEYTPGQTGDLVVEGGATHGGGSGQMVITYEFPPTKETVWKVMQSWEGDHPVKADGNTSGDANEKHPNPIKFAIPEGLPAGKAVVAWSWFNRIGNREWYMKCATVNIKQAPAKAGQTPQEVLNSLPDMYRANVASLSPGCSIPDSVSAIDFGKSAGENVVVAPGAQPVLVDGCPGSTGTPAKMPQGGDEQTETPTQPETPSQPEAPVPTSTYVEQPAGPTSAPEQGGSEEGDDNSESGSGDSEELPTKPAEPIASPSPIAQPDNSNKGTDSGSSGSCVEGTTVCSEGNTWSQCGSGRLQNMGLVPAGLTCNGGKLIAKRALRFSAEHRRHRSRHV